MANKDAAFGLRAIGKVGQNRDNQGLSEYDIAPYADHLMVFSLLMLTQASLHMLITLTHLTLQLTLLDSYLMTHMKGLKYNQTAQLQQQTSE